LGLIVPDIADPFFGEMARCVEDAGFERGYSVLLCNSDQRLDKELAYARSLIEAQVDGILFVAASPSAEGVQLIQEHGIATVLVDRELPQARADRILIDNVAGGRTATEHLLQLGHRRIACIGAPSTRLPFGGRVRGYREAMAGAGLAVDESLVVRGTSTGNGHYEGIGHLFARPDPPTALFACNDRRAMDALESAVAAGINVPFDLSIVGFDDIRASSMTRPALTTLAQPKKEIGQLAVRMLLERIRSPGLPPRTEVLPPQLVVRGSTARRKAV
jgi:LacI family transcriptional regulator